MNRGVHILVWVLLILTFPADAANKQVKIGVLAFRGTQTAMEMWKPTADYLSQQIPTVRFDIVPLDLLGMHSHVQGGRLDFVLTNTGNYVDLESRYGISRIATVKNLRQGRAYTQFGAVIFTRANHPSVEILADLKGHDFMAVSREAFGGFQMAWRELLRHDIDPFQDFKHLYFAGFPQDEIVYAVQRGEVDAGTVRTDTLERMAQEGRIKLSSFLVLNQQATPGFPFLHSTDLYPEWPFAKLRHTADELAEQVAVALLRLPADSPVANAARSAGWTIPLDYGPVHELFRVLKIGPYEHLNQLSLSRVWEEYGPWITVAVIAVLTLAAVTSVLLRANRRIATESSEREQAQLELAAHRDSLERRVTERTGELAQLNQALQQSEQTLRILHDITASSNTSFEQKVSALLDAGCEYYDMTSAALTQVDDDGCRILQVNTNNPLFSAGDVLAIGATLCAATVESRQPVSIIDLGRSRFADHPFVIDRGQRCYLGTPVVADGQTIGTLYFVDERARAESRTQVDVDILLLMAQWIGGEMERQRAHEELQTHQSQLAHVARLHTMGEMASGIAHELNQPLTAIVNYAKGSLRRLKGNKQPGDDIVQALQRMADEAERAGVVIKRLREFVRRGALRREWVDPKDVLSSVTALAARQLRTHHISFESHVKDDCPHIYVDKIQIEQVVLNLILNGVDALKANGPPRTLSVSFEPEHHNGAMLIVQDNGRGMSDEALARAFDPFYTTKIDGLGLGLSISRSIVEAHGGRIDARPAPGGGTRFMVRLPRVAESVNAASA